MRPLDVKIQVNDTIFTKQDDEFNFLIWSDDGKCFNMITNEMLDSPSVAKVLYRWKEVGLTNKLKSLDMEGR